MSNAELRVYRIEAGHLDDFVSAWRGGVEPLRRRFGFTSRAWMLPRQSLFVWLVAYDGKGTFEAADAAYYASPERASLDPDPRQWIVANETGSAVPLSGGRSSAGDSAPSAR
jgi:hypothetical protein